jgi:hypothetical protein
MNRSFILALSCLALSSHLPAQERSKFSAWQLYKDVDKMDGSVTEYIVTESLTPLLGWVNSGKVLFGMTCEDRGRFYLRANGIGWHTDDLDCDNYENCPRVQNGRIKVDDEKPSPIRYRVWDDTNDGMSLITESLPSKLKAGNKLLLEVTAFHTEGRDQVMEFDLTGFASAWKACGMEERIQKIEATERAAQIAREEENHLVGLANEERKRNQQLAAEEAEKWRDEAWSDNPTNKACANAQARVMDLQAAGFTNTAQHKQAIAEAKTACSNP